MMPKLNTDAYHRIGALGKVIDWINNGVPLNFKSEPNACCHANRINNDKQSCFTDDELKKLVVTGAILPVSEIPKCTLAMSCVPKKNGKLRLVIDCRPLNKFTDCPSFTQEGIDGKYHTEG